MLSIILRWYSIENPGVCDSMVVSFATDYIRIFIILSFIPVNNNLLSMYSTEYSTEYSVLLLLLVGIFYLHTFST